MEYTINIKGCLMDLSTPQVMGILNVTPDSFYSGSRKQTEMEIAQRANQIIEEGGSIIDVGAFSTRPGADEVSEEEEGRRLKFALDIVRREQPDAAVSVDTYRPTLARKCIEEWGADIINDASTFFYNLISSLSYLHFCLFSTARVETVGRNVQDAHHLRGTQIHQAPLDIDCIFHRIITS